MHAQIVLFDGFDALDAVALFEVLAAGSDATDGDLVVELVCADGPRPVASGTRGLVLLATARLDPTRSGFVIVPGASGPVGGVFDDGVETMTFVVARFAGTTAMTSIRAAMDNPEVTVAVLCGGSLALARAGLLEERPVDAQHSGVNVRVGTGVFGLHAQVVDDGHLVTAGVMTSGLELALYLLDRLYGPRVALAVEALFTEEHRGTCWLDTGLRPRELA